MGTAHQTKPQKIHLVGKGSKRVSPIGLLLPPPPCHHLAAKQQTNRRPSVLPRVPPPIWEVPNGRSRGPSLVNMGPERLVQSLEGGSVGRVAAPTAHHQLEEGGGAEGRGIEEDLSALIPEELSSVLDDLLV